jgi:hypothetical protein
VGSRYLTHIIAVAILDAATVGNRPEADDFANVTVMPVVDVSGDADAVHAHRPPDMLAAGILQITARAGTVDADHMADATLINVIHHSAAGDLAYLAARTIIDTRHDKYLFPHRETGAPLAVRRPAVRRYRPTT